MCTCWAQPVPIVARALYAMVKGMSEAVSWMTVGSITKIMATCVRSASSKPLLVAASESATHQATIADCFAPIASPAPSKFPTRMPAARFTPKQKMNWVGWGWGGGGVGMGWRRGGGGGVGG